jgi:hypothetical protein
MSLPAWIGIPAAVVLLAFIARGFRQGMQVTTRQEGKPSGRDGG